jgi:hypothetical protein
MRLTQHVQRLAELHTTARSCHPRFSGPRLQQVWHGCNARCAASYAAVLAGLSGRQHMHCLSLPHSYCRLCCFLERDNPLRGCSISTNRHPQSIFGLLFSTCKTLLIRHKGYEPPTQGVASGGLGGGLHQSYPLHAHVRAVILQFTRHFEKLNYAIICPELLNGVFCDNEEYKRGIFQFCYQHISFLRLFCI